MSETFNGSLLRMPLAESPAGDALVSPRLTHVQTPFFWFRTKWLREASAQDFTLFIRWDAGVTERREVGDGEMERMMDL